MLRSITLERFKSFRHKSVLPLSSLTVMIGANASGKSNAIEGLRFFSWLAQGQKLSSIQYEVNGSDEIVRGRIEDLPYDHADAFRLGCITDDEEWNELKMEIAIRDDELHITDEELTGPAAPPPLYRIVEPARKGNSDIFVEYNNFARGSNKPRIVCNDQMAIFGQLESAARFAPKHEKSKEIIPKISHELSVQLSNILFLDPVPANMREYAFKTEKRLSGDGKNLSAILYRLWEESDRKEKNRERILAFIRSLPEQDIETLGFINGPRGEVMVQLVETFGGVSKAYDASLLSDGTLRVLAIAAALLSAPEGSMVVIEEIDNGVHPSRARNLLERIDEIARERSLNILLSTHNPALLDALPDAAIPHIVFCYRDPADGSSRMIRLMDLPDYPELVEQGGIGELMTQGILEQFIKHHPGTEEKKRKAMAWLKSIAAGVEQ